MRSNELLAERLEFGVYVDIWSMFSNLCQVKIDNSDLIVLRYCNGSKFYKFLDQITLMRINHKNLLLSMELILQQPFYSKLI